MKVVEVRAFPLSVDMRDRSVAMGVGTQVKLDTVVVRVRTEDGITGYGEAHHGLAPTMVAELVNSSLAPLVVGEDAMAVEHIWEKIYHRQGRTHGPGWALYKAMSGIDIALWDVRGKALNIPVWSLLGGKKRRIRAYAGGASLGYQPPEQLAEEAARYVEQGFTAIKLRLGDTVERDLERVRHVRRVLGESVDIMVDINTKYSYHDLMRAIPGLEDANVFWIEEPFPPDALRDYSLSAQRTRIPLAAGENHFLRYQARQLLESEAVQVIQPDTSKAGGITEVKKIADLAAAYRRPFAGHTSMSGLSYAAMLSLETACMNTLVYEAGVAAFNPFRDALVSRSPVVGSDGCVEAFDGPGLGVEVDESLFEKYPGIPGPCYV